MLLLTSRNRRSVTSKATTYKRCAIACSFRENTKQAQNFELCCRCHKKDYVVDNMTTLPPVFFLNPFVFTFFNGAQVDKVFLRKYARVNTSSAKKQLVKNCPF